MKILKKGQQLMSWGAHSNEEEFNKKEGESGQSKKGGVNCLLGEGKKQRNGEEGELERIDLCGLNGIDGSLIEMCEKGQVNQDGPVIPTNGNLIHCSDVVVRNDPQCDIPSSLSSHSVLSCYSSSSQSLSKDSRSTHFSGGSVLCEASIGDSDIQRCNDRLWEEHQVSVAQLIWGFANKNLGVWWG